jgi:hypothetical protein
LTPIGFSVIIVATDPTFLAVALEGIPELFDDVT